MGDLLNLETLKIIGLPGLIIVGLGFTIWRLFKHYLDMQEKYDQVQEKRVQEAQKYQKEYFDLTTDVNKTLDILVKSFARKNSNEGSSND